MTLQTPPPPSLPLPLSIPLPPLPTLPFFPPPSPPPPPPPPTYIKFENKISPSILLIIVILTIIFFISGLLHLLIRFILKPINREAEDHLDNNVTVLQGQLQQLFHLHDSGVDQSCIDTLPIFLYKAIIGLKDPFDCAVCLCEFEPDDKLRLLPMCSHAFHLGCIDTWLLSHSTCPLCRTSLLLPHHDHCLVSPACCIPMVLVLESGNVSSREICSSDQVLAEHDGHGHDLEHDDQSMQIVQVLDDVLEEKLMVPVKLGKFRSTTSTTTTAHDQVHEGTSSDQKIDQRRCFSMGSCEYVMDHRSLLQVAIKPSSNKKKIMSGRFHSSRSFESSDHHHNHRAIGNVLQKESFSFSKIWLKEKHKESSSVLSRSEEAPSFARRTLLWLVGKQENKMVNQV
ncbi:RING-H2 finger protein ATL13-like [Dioscorea cayenensis subsp. rotundata]|uniref:RING-type E3 ubiquitin transferase n=1 Tax=Dioscorea cayennensis subsp. rotundata TaxID=55577 RepID=A0AB40BST5_DIOCR|nr:RING-H2 finger protein ATL13-like [Dioscorea cayenensis subsp. rotundata]